MLDVYSRKIVGHEVYRGETGELASEFIIKAYWREHLATKERPLVLHSDSNNVRTGVSNDNAYSESLFKTLKFRPGFPVNGFRTIEDARKWVLAFVRWYNTEHGHSALNYVTPQQRHTVEADRILAQRKQVITAAKLENPLLLAW